MKFVLNILAYLAVCTVSWADGGYTVVGGNGPRYEQATLEFIKYASAITDKKPLGDSGLYILIGGPEVNKTTAALVEKRLLSVPREIVGTDGFVVTTVAAGARKYLILAGDNPTGTLYAVYSYFETVCHCGFFEDGERIPRLDSLPVPKSTIVEVPRFKNRMYRLWPALALKKNQCMYWSKADWKREFDWFAKKKLNMLWGWMCREDLPYGAVFDIAFPEIGPPPAETPYSDGHPMAWSWPLDYRRRMARSVITYARSLGIRHIYFIEYGYLPGRFKDAHPELTYIQPYGQQNEKAFAFLDPRDPRSGEVYKRFVETVNSVYGTDHLYQFEPYAESAMGPDPQTAFQMKFKASREGYSFLKKADPDATWVHGGWDNIVFFKTIWTPENMKKYCTEQAPVGLYQTDEVIEHVYDDECLYKLYDYYYGREWAAGSLLTLGGHNNQHGRFDEMIRRMKSLADDPRASKCTGMFYESESTGQNIMLCDLYFKLAWNPQGVTPEGFVRDFCLRRYGTASEKMIRATRLVIDACITTGDFNDPGYTMLYRFYGAADEHAAESAARYRRKAIPMLHKAMQLLLSEKQQQTGNKLYENDLVYYFLAYTEELFNQRFAEAYLAFVRGDKTAFDAHSSACLTVLEQVERVLATRKDYSLQDTIDQAVNVPGANPNLAENIRAGSVWKDYTTSPVYETFSLYFRPRLEHYFGVMRDRIDSIDRSIDMSKDMDPEVDRLRAEFAKADLRGVGLPPFVQSSVESVAAAMRNLRKLEPVPEPKEKRTLSQGLRAVLGQSNVCEGLYQVESDHTGCTSVVEKGGLECRTPGERIFGFLSKSIHFDVPNSVVYNDRKWTKLFVTVRYFDEGDGELYVAYDSADESGTLDSAHKHTEHVKLTNSGKWVTKTFVLPDARFANRQFSRTDFRVAVKNGSLFLREVTLSDIGLGNEHSKIILVPAQPG